MNHKKKQWFTVFVKMHFKRKKYIVVYFQNELVIIWSNWLCAERYQENATQPNPQNWTE